MALSLKYYILNPLHGILHRFSRQWIALRYFKAYHRPMETRNPRLYHDKVFWLMNNTPQERQARLADKYAVRQYVAARAGESLLAKLYGVYESADKIDFDALPRSFVLKTNNGCTTNIIVRDKAQLDRRHAVKKLSRWMGIHFGDLTGERHYSLIKPLIIAEELLVQDGDPDKPLIDYKLECFDGKPAFCTVFSDRVEGTHTKKCIIYDMDWKPVPDSCAYSLSHIIPGPVTPPPPCWDEMKRIAARLAEGFEYVRVDFYVIDGRPMFGEMSFTPGMDTDYTLGFQRRLGDMIRLPQRS